MKMIDIDEFLPDLLPELSNCPTPVVERRLREALIECCERAPLWRWNHPEIPVVADEVNYEFGTPIEESLVHSVLSLRVNGRPLTSSSDAELRQVIGQKFGYNVPDRGSIELLSVPRISSERLTQSPRTRYGIEACLSIKPTRKATKVAQVIFDDYHSLIIAMTLSKAMNMVDRQWSNPKQSDMLYRRSEYLLGRARQQYDRGFTTKSQKLKPRSFG